MDKGADRFVVGVDAGGTSLRVLVAEAGTGSKRGFAEGEADHEGGTTTLLPLVHAALTEAGARVAEVGAVCAGITKITRSGVREHWRDALAHFIPHLTDASRRVTPDYVIAFHGALPEGIGIAVIAGTGSVVYGEDGQGGTVRVGGRGWEFGDEGIRPLSQKRSVRFWKPTTRRNLVSGHGDTR
jgi:N-acetylglucosamine kinase-like BadF-type ATPase